MTGGTDPAEVGEVLTRADWTREMAALLWPSPERVRYDVGRGRPGVGERDFAPFPSWREPRLVVPLASRRAAASVVRRWAHEGSFARRSAGELLALAIGSGGSSLVLGKRFRVSAPDGRPAGIDGYLAEVLGAELHPVLYVTRPRANRKPVLELVDARGRPAAYVKLGVDPLTRGLVAREAAALLVAAAAGLRSVRVPAVLHHGSWAGLEVLVLSPLPLSQADAATPPELLAAGMAEVAGVGGHEQCLLAATAYRPALGERLARLPAPHRAVLEQALHLVDAFAQDRPLRFGAWHGDWATWNSASLAGQLLVWDWERFATGVPVGYDVVHHALHQLVLDPSLDTRALVAAYATTVEPLLRQVDVAPAVAGLVTVLYLLEITSRYLGDGQQDVGNLRPVLTGLVQGTLLAAQALGSASVTAAGPGAPR